MIVRQEQQEDKDGIFELNALAFGQEEEGHIVNKIREGENFLPELSLVLAHGDKIVGHLLFSKAKINSDQEYETLVLAPMAITPNFQRKGMGSLLLREGLRTAKKMGFQSIFVLGHPEYYPKFGFKKASTWKIKCPFEAPDDAFMALELVEDALNNKKGIVEYDVAFQK